jgi:bacteriocin biosynthesis cyclodehydratase domain-containing protein
VNSTLLRIPRSFEILASNGGGYTLVSLLRSLRVRSDHQQHLLASILPLLVRGASLETLLSATSSDTRPRVLEILRELTSRGLLEEVPSSSADNSEAYTEQERFFANFAPITNQPLNPVAAETAPTAAAQRKLAEARVLVSGLGRVGSRLVCSLAHAGVGTIWGADPAGVNDGDVLDSGYGRGARGAIREQWLAQAVERINPDIAYRPLGATGGADPALWPLPDALNLLVLCEDSFHPGRYDSVNRLCLDHELTWTSCRSLGVRYEVGPIIVPRQTACFKCFELRKSSNLDSYDEYRETWQSLAVRNASLGSLNITFGAEVLALEAVKLLTGFSRPLTYGSLFSFDLLTLEASIHPILKIPRCPQCSPASAQRPGLIIWPPGEGFEDL